MDNIEIYDYLFDRSPEDSCIYFGGVPYEQEMRQVKIKDIRERSKAFHDVYDWVIGTDPAYFNQVCQTGATEWPTVIESVGITHLWVDFDLTENKPGKNYPTRQEVLDLLEVIQPNILVDSGHGYHAYFKLSNIYRAREIVKMGLIDACKDFQEYFSKVLNDRKVDDISRLSRILRVPGSRNAEEMVKILRSDTSFEYNLERIIELSRRRDETGEHIVDISREEIAAYIRN